VTNITDYNMDYNLKLIEEKDRFRQHLERCELSDKTIWFYLYWFEKFVLIKDKESNIIGHRPYNQESINEFLTPKSHRHTPIKSMLRHLKEYIIMNKIEGYLDAQSVILPRVKKHKKRELPEVLKEEEVIKIGNAMKTARDRLMLLLTYNFGLRVADIFNLKEDNFNFTEWNEHPDKYGRLKIPTRKRGKKWQFIVPPNIMNYTFTYINSLKLTFTNFDKTKTTIFFDTSRSKWQKLLTKLGEKVLEKKVYPHLLRHSIASELSAEGMPVEILKDFLGHDDISTTMIYVHVSQERAEEEYRRIQQKRDDKFSEQQSNSPTSQDSSPVEVVNPDEKSVDSKEQSS
jgi:integrase/recombinase XerD